MARWFYRLLRIIPLTCALCLAGCFNLRNSAVFRRLAEQEGERAAKYTEEALRKSPDLQELEHLCTREVPPYEGFVFRSRDASPPKRTYLSFFYDSGADYRRVKPFYVDHFAQTGWKVTKEYDGDWGPKSVEFRKGNYRVVLFHGGMGDAEYALHCEKLSDSGGPLLNKAMDATRH